MLLHIDILGETFSIYKDNKIKSLWKTYKTKQPYYMYIQKNMAKKEIRNLIHHLYQNDRFSAKIETNESDIKSKELI